MHPEDIAFVGVGDVTRYDQFRGLLDRGFHVVPGSQILRQGAASALRPLVEQLGERCDTVYVSLDIDVLDSAVATGTGHVTMGGIDTGHLLDVYEELRALPVEAVDIAEVAPATTPPAAPRSSPPGCCSSSSSAARAPRPTWPPGPTRARNRDPSRPLSGPGHDIE